MPLLQNTLLSCVKSLRPLKMVRMQRSFQCDLTRAFRAFQTNVCCVADAGWAAGDEAVGPKGETDWRTPQTRWCSELFLDQWMWLLCLLCRWCCSRSLSSRVCSGSCRITIPVWRTPLHLCASRVGCACLCRWDQRSCDTFTDVVILVSWDGRTPDEKRRVTSRTTRGIAHQTRVHVLESPNGQKFTATINEITWMNLGVWKTAQVERLYYHLYITQIDQKRPNFDYKETKVNYIKINIKKNYAVKQKWLRHQM